MKSKLIQAKSPVGAVVEVGDPITHTKKPNTNPFGGNVTIAGPLPVGSVLTCNVTLVGTPTVVYNWQTGFSALQTGAANTYLVTSGDVGKNISCVVAATNLNGFSMARRSNVIVPTL